MSAAGTAAACSGWGDQRTQKASAASVKPMKRLPLSPR